RGTESHRPVLFRVLIDFRGAARELLVIVKQSSVMVQVLHVHFVSPVLDYAQIFFRDRIAFLRDYLKRSWNLKPVVDVHQLRTEYAPGFRLHIVCHDSRALRAVWPEPDEGNLRQPFRLERQYEQLLKDTV